MPLQFLKMPKYSFKYVVNCDMCGEDISNHKRLGQRLNQSQGLNPKNKIGISVSVNKCNNCGLIYSTPQPIPFNIQDHYGIPSEDYWTSEYFELDSMYFLKQIKTVKKLLSFDNGMTALDIGCGIGKCIIQLEKNGFIAYGVEPSKTFYQKAISVMNIKKDKIQFCPIEDVNFSNEKFDFITYGAVFEYLYNPSTSLKRALSWLKPNGIIQIEVPSSKNLNSKLINIYYKLRCSNYVTNLSPMHSPFHLFEFDIRSFKILGSRLGFEVVEFSYEAGTVHYIPRVFHSIFRRFMSITNTENQLTVYLKKVENPAVNLF